MGDLQTTIRRMEYPVLDGSAVASAGVRSADPAEGGLDLEARMAERERQFAADLEKARRLAFEKGRQAALQEQGDWQRQCGSEMSKALLEFSAQTDEYLARVEHEVVRLALAIAERILHREAQMDPLLLAGAVRVALGQLADSTKVRLRVDARQAEMWSEMLRLMPSLPLRPEVLGDPELQPGEVVLETDLGTVDLGTRAQIREIERGFFDLLAVRRDVAAEERPVSSAPPARTA